MDIVLWSRLSSAVETSLPTDGLVPADPAGRPKGLWIDPVRFLELIDGWALAQWACALARAWRNRLHPALPSGRHSGGAPQTYRDETILLTMLVLRAWRLSLEKMAGWLARYDALAIARGMSPGCTISAAQLSRRSRQLGLWPYFFLFVGLVGWLVRLGAITGRQVILDGSLLRAWYRQDPDADLAGRRRGPPTYGYKIHALVDRWTHLPLLFVLTPASWHEVTIAPFLLVTAIVLYRLRISVLYADSAYYTHRFVTFVRALGIIPIIDYQLRRLGKRFLATLFFLDQWRRLRAPRTAAERCFAFLKRYYGLKYFQVTGWEAVWRSALLIHTAMLAVAVIAYRLDRPDLMTSRAHVLAFVTN
jgi:hypothetical protein